MSESPTAASEIAALRREKAALQEALAATTKSEEQFRTMLAMIPTLVWRTRADGYAEFFSQRWHDYTGMAFEEARGAGWTAAFHPDDLQALSARWMEIVASEKPSEVEARFRRHDGEYRWHLMRSVPLFDDQGKLVSWCGTNTDIDDLKRAETLLAAEKKLFEMIATGHSLLETLRALCLTVEDLVEGSIASILLMDEDGKRLRHGAAPSLPASYLLVIDGGLIGPRAGSCGTAAYLKGKVFVTDIATDPLWTDYAELALRHDLRACFSIPILSSEVKVLGTFAFYSKQVRPITLLEDRIADRFANIASILIERKHAENALAKSEALLAEGQRISQTGSWIWNVSTGKIVWSEEHGRIFGFRIDELNVDLESFLQTVYGPDLARVQTIFDDAVRRGCEFSVEYRINLADGSLKHIHTRGRPVAGELGQVNEFVGTAMDISYRYEAKLALERALAKAVASEDQLRTLIDNLPGLAWTAGPNGEAEFLSQGWLKYTGMTEEEASGPGWANAIHPDDVGLMVERWQRIIATKMAGEQDARLRRYDGVYRWFSFRGAPLLDPSGHIVKWYGVNVDITEQYHAQAALEEALARIRKSEDELRTIIDTIPTLAWSSPGDGVGGFFSKRWLDYTGLSHEDAQGTGWVVAIHPDDRETLAATWTKIRASGKEGGLEARLRRFDGVYRWFLFRAAPFRDPMGNDVVWYGTNTDIEDLKQAEAGLRQREADLRKAQAELAHVTRVTTIGELAASIAHEVNQPIAGVVINGNACIRWLSHLKEESAPLAEARESVQRILRDGKRAGDVIGRIRTLFKKAETAKEPLDLNEAIREVMILTKSEMDKQRVAPRLELAEGLPAVIGDRVQLQQVMINLILNGIDAMSAVEGRPRELVVGTELLDGAQVSVTVRDSGAGLDPANIDQLFAAFHTTKPGGLGMGLSISRSIVESHGGRLWATANEGAGAVFRFTLLSHLGSTESESGK